MAKLGTVDLAVPAAGRLRLAVLRSPQGGLAPSVASDRSSMEGRSSMPRSRFCPALATERNA